MKIHQYKFSVSSLIFIVGISICIIIQFTLAEESKGSDADAKQEKHCKKHKLCRDNWKKMDKDSLQKYDQFRDPFVGEYMCLHTEPCIEERKRFCKEHKDDGHELVKENCDEWESEGWKV